MASLTVVGMEDTRATLHMYLQIVGKVRMALSPLINHWWEVPFYVTADGLTTSPIPYEEGVFEVQFDFNHHTLKIETNLGATASLLLRPLSVADFYQNFMATLKNLRIQVEINTMPSEVLQGIRFDRDQTHASYDPEYVNRFWRILVSTDTVLKEFRARSSAKLALCTFSGVPWT